MYLISQAGDSNTQEMLVSKTTFPTGPGDDSWGMFCKVLSPRLFSLVEKCDGQHCPLTFVEQCGSVWFWSSCVTFPISKPTQVTHDIAHKLSRVHMGDLTLLDDRVHPLTICYCTEKSTTTVCTKKSSQNYSTRTTYDRWEHHFL